MDCLLRLSRLGHGLSLGGGHRRALLSLVRNRPLFLVDHVSALDSVLVNKETLGLKLLHLILVPHLVVLCLKVVWSLLLLSHFVPLLTDQLLDLGDRQLRVLVSKRLLVGVAEEEEGSAWLLWLNNIVTDHWLEQIF